MKFPERKRALAGAVQAARAAGKLMRQNLRATKKVNDSTRHDLKLELDVRCQKLIERMLRAHFPHISLLGEEGSAGQADTDCRWVVDPIDGTVNFAYGIPHACVSIALQMRSVERGTRNLKSRITHHASPAVDYITIVGVVYDPFTDEMWTAVRGQPARLNGRIIRVSNRSRLSEAIVGTGFAKSHAILRISLPYFNRLVWKVRKIRMMGAAALSLVYVATGRFDAYLERSVSVWDIAAGGLILECAGGEFWRKSIPGHEKYQLIATNGLLRKKLRVPQ